MAVPSAIHPTDEIVNPETFKIERRAIKDAAEAYNVCKRIEMWNRDRNYKNTAILRRFNDAPPYDQSTKLAAGAGWQSNYSTGVMSSLVKRACVPYNQMIDQAETLTSSRLEDEDPVSEQKTKVFQTQITKTVRQWNGFLNFKEQIIQENNLYGYTFGGYLDKIEWRPTFFKSDSVLFEDGCGQVPEEVPLLCFVKSYLLHKLSEKFDDVQAAIDAGWNLKNLAIALNMATPENVTGAFDWRKIEEAARETTVGNTYVGGVNVVETYTLLACEYTGRVSSYFLNKRTGAPLLIELDKYESMDEAISLFTLETGNGKLHGSKGAGRLLYNSALAAENARNQAKDNLYLSGMLVLQQDDKNIPKPTITVAHPFCIIPKGFTATSQKFTVNTEAFVELDQMIIAQCQSQIGAYMPSSLSNPGNNETAAKVNYVASIESTIRDAQLSRFWGQFLAVIFNMQKRMCTKEVIAEAYEKYMEEKNSIVRFSNKFIEFLRYVKSSLMLKKPELEEFKNDKAAVMCCLRMLRKGLTQREIFELANTPPQEAIKENQTMRSQAITEIVAKYTNDPMVDQQKLKFMDIAAKLGYDAAKDLLPEEYDASKKSDQISKQLMEITSIFAGEDMPISTEDDDLTHLEVVRQKLDKLIAIFTKGQQGGITAVFQFLPTLKLLVAHLDRHLQAAQAKGIKPEVLQPYSAISQLGNQLLTQVPPPPATLPAPGAHIMDASQAQNGQIQPIQNPSDPSAQTELSAMGPATAAAAKPLSKGPVNLTPQV